MSDDPELETFLRQFRPVAPPPLGGRGTVIGRGLAVLAAIAAVVALVRLGGPRPSPTPAPREIEGAPPTIGLLNAALREGRHEAVLDQLSTHILPDPLRAGGALRIVGRLYGDRQEGL